MSLQYSGGALINRTFVPTTRAEWVGNVTQALLDAGWTTISGTPGSTTAGTDVKMQCAANNNGAKIRFRFLDSAAGTSATITMKNVAETITSLLTVAASTGNWRIVANKFHFFAFLTGGANAIAARGVIMGGTIYTPTFYGPPTDNIGWLVSSGGADGDSATAETFRRRLRRSAAGGSRPASSTIVGSSLSESSTTAVGTPSIPVWQGGNNVEDQAWRWDDNTVPIYEPLMAWGSGSSLVGESKIRGQLYDALVMNGNIWTSESTFTFDGHTWLVITDAPAGSGAQTAVLCLAVA